MKILHYTSSTLLLAGFILALSACAIEPSVIPSSTLTNETETQKANISNLAPSSPIQINLTISKLPLLNEPVDLTCNIASIIDAPNSAAKIRLSKGSDLIRGDLQWQGDLTANTPVSFSFQIVFQETGHHTIEATVSCKYDERSSYGDLDAIYLDIGIENSTFGWPVTPVLVARSDKYGAIQTDIEISHIPRINEPAKLFITTLSTMDFQDLSIGILISPKTVALTSGNSELSVVQLVPGANQYYVQISGVDLKAGVPFHCSAIVVFQETGYYRVTADATQEVNNVNYHGIQDTISFTIDAN